MTNKQRLFLVKSSGSILNALGKFKATRAAPKSKAVLPSIPEIDVNAFGNAWSPEGHLRFPSDTANFNNRWRFGDNQMGARGATKRLEEAENLNAAKKWEPSHVLPIEKYNADTHMASNAKEAITQKLDAMKQRGQAYDGLGSAYADHPLARKDFIDHGMKGGRHVVEYTPPSQFVPDARQRLNSQLFYRSSGAAGKAGKGVDGTTKDMWQPYGGHYSGHLEPAKGFKPKFENWFIKDDGYATNYGSKTFDKITGGLDELFPKQKMMFPPKPVANQTPTPAQIPPSPTY